MGTLEEVSQQEENHASQIGELQTSITKLESHMENKFNELDKKWDMRFNQMFPLPTAEMGASNSADGVRRCTEPDTPSNLIHNQNSGNNNTFLHQPKLDFPRFDGSNPRAWAKKCHKFFTIHPTDDLKKVEVASFYLDGKADAWFLNYQVAKPNANWNELVDDICLHFEDVNQGNYVGNFNKLTQSGSVDDYFTQFEELKSYMLTKHSPLSDEYFVLSFLSGLKDDIRSQVQMFRPTSLTQAVYLARLQEGVIDLQHPKSKFSPKYPFSFHGTTSKISTPTVSSTNFTVAGNVILALSFIIVIAVILGASENERPTKPIRVWLGVCIGFWVVVLFLSAIPTGIRFASRTMPMVILLLAGIIAWWVVGLYLIIAGGKELMDDAPLLFWLTAVLLGMAAVWGLGPMVNAVDDTEQVDSAP